MYNKISGIYKITNPQGLVYIGQSYNIHGRYIRYKKLSCKSQCRIYNSLKKYGFENHTFEILQQAPKEELNQLEINYIWRYDSTNREKGLNLNKGGYNGNHSEETKDKIRQKAFGRKASDETKAKMSLTAKGRTKSEEWKRKIGISKNRVKVSTEINGVLHMFNSMEEASKATEVNAKTISLQINRNSKRSKSGLLWKRVN